MRSAQDFKGVKKNGKNLYETPLLTIMFGKSVCWDLRNNVHKHFWSMGSQMWATSYRFAHFKPANSQYPPIREALTT